MASILKQLNDDDLDAVRHMIRKGAMTAAQIGIEAARRLPEPFKAKFEGLKAGARDMVITRYRQSGEFTRWLRAWENRDQDLRKAIELQKQRFDLLSNLVKDPSEDGMKTLSKGLQARLLTLAAEASDEELIEGTTKGGWIKNVITVVQDEAKNEQNAKAEEFKAEIERLSNGGEKKVDAKQLVDRVDELMGLKKKV